MVTADCKHWGCTVDWDPAASEWACPCHGSRYAADGKVVHGPAEESLEAPPVKVADGALVIDLSALRPE